MPWVVGNGVYLKKVGFYCHNGTKLRVLLYVLETSILTDGALGNGVNSILFDPRP